MLVTLIVIKTTARTTSKSFELKDCNQRRILTFIVLLNREVLIPHIPNIYKIEAYLNQLLNSSVQDMATILMGNKKNKHTEFQVSDMTEFMFSILGESFSELDALSRFIEVTPLHTQFVISMAFYTCGSQFESAIAEGCVVPILIRLAKNSHLNYNDYFNLL